MALDLNSETPDLENTATEHEEEDLVRIYLAEIGRYPLLTKEDEGRLARQIEARKAAHDEFRTLTPGTSTERRHELSRAMTTGDQARQLFIQSNLRLVVSIAKRYQASGLPLLDLIQEGNLGLVHAVEKFDWRKGFKFSTYATWWIRQAVTRGIANTGRTIRLPVHAGDILLQAQKARDRLEVRFSRRATLAEVSTEAGITEDKLIEVLGYGAEPVSLSTPLGELGDGELGDIIEDRSSDSPFEMAAKALLSDEVCRLLAPLAEREREILRLHFGLDRGAPLTLKEIGEQFNLTRERIRQIELRAISKLRLHGIDSGACDLSTI